MEVGQERKLYADISQERQKPWQQHFSGQCEGEVVKRGSIVDPISGTGWDSTAEHTKPAKHRGRGVEKIVAEAPKDLSGHSGIRTKWYSVNRSISQHRRSAFYKGKVSR